MKLFCIEDHDEPISTMRHEADGIWCHADEHGWHDWNKWKPTEFDFFLFVAYIEGEGGVRKPYERKFQEQRRTCKACGYTQSCAIRFGAGHQ